MNKTDVMEKIYLEYREKVFRYVRGKVRNEADAEDILSEIFLKIQTSLHSYDEKKATLSTWIYTITHNTVCNYYREQSRSALSLDENALCSDTDDVMAEIENEILKEKLAIALASLTEREQDVIVLYYYHEIPLWDIAIKMGITYTNAKFIKHQAINKLKCKMKEIDDEL